tara:strand:- start:250 stop:351 length:102 start_codon:yes stop_codon:yes gene_type:complete
MFIILRLYTGFLFIALVAAAIISPLLSLPDLDL